MDGVRAWDLHRCLPKWLMTSATSCSMTAQSPTALNTACSQLMWTTWGQVRSIMCTRTLQGKHPEGHQPIDVSVHWLWSRVSVFYVGASSLITCVHVCILRIWPSRPHRNTYSYIGLMEFNWLISTNPLITHVVRGVDMGNSKLVYTHVLKVPLSCQVAHTHTDILVLSVGILQPMIELVIHAVWHSKVLTGMV